MLVARRPAAAAAGIREAGGTAHGFLERAGGAAHGLLKRFHVDRLSQAGLWLSERLLAPVAHQNATTRLTPFNYKGEGVQVRVFLPGSPASS